MATFERFVKAKFTSDIIVDWHMVDWKFWFLVRCYTLIMLLIGVRVIMKNNEPLTVVAYTSIGVRMVDDLLKERFLSEV